MAPIKKRTRTRARVAKSLRPLPDSTSDPTPSTFEPDLEAHNATPFSSFTATKRDKQRMKHSQLLSRIEKTAPGKITKRRRPRKKLVAGLEGLLDSLPDVADKNKDSGADEEDEWEGISDDEFETKIARIRRRRRGDVTASADGKMVLKTLKSRPGALKKKAKMEEQERERFRLNMAQMAKPVNEQAAATNTDGEANTSSARWAALRGFIGQTMQQNPAFMK